MTPKKTTPGQVWLTLGVSLLAAENLFGQDVLMSSPAPALRPMAMADSEINNPMNVFLPSGPPGKPFQYGPLNFRPHVTYSLSYGNGIQAGPGNQQDTAVSTLSPGLTVDLGRHWVLDYTPSFRFYSNNKFTDGVDHSASLSGGTHYEDWTLGLTQGFSYSTAPTVQTAAQTEQQNYSTALSANYAFNSKMSADFGLNQALNFVSGFQDSRTWSTMDWLNYFFWDRLNAGLGVGAGYVNVTDSGAGINNPDQVYEQLQGRVNWRATDKVSFQINGGFEDRQLQTSAGSDTLNPIFGASIQYQPFQPTQISLSANRSVGSSDYYVSAQTSENTSFSLNLNQRLLKTFSLNLGAGYTQTDYTQNGFTGGNNRTDESYSLSAGLSHPFLKRGTWSLSYQYSDNRSTQVGYAYQSSQVAFTISYAY